MSSADLDVVRSLVARTQRDLRSIDGSLGVIDETVTAEEQVLMLASLVEAARAARAGMDDLCTQLAEIALLRGATPRLLDWSDGTAD
jgi:predicted transcriptional regulator